MMLGIFSFLFFYRQSYLYILCKFPKSKDLNRSVAIGKIIKKRGSVKTKKVVTGLFFKNKKEAAMKKTVSSGLFFKNKKEVFKMLKKVNLFDIMLLIVGIAVAYLGYRLINLQYQFEGQMSWLMIVSIFLWLILLVLFILSSMTVDSSRQQLKEIRILNELLQNEIREVEILKKDFRRSKPKRR